jgi:hypothetical protein
VQGLGWGRAGEVETVGGIEIILASMQGCSMDKGFNPLPCPILPLAKVIGPW